MAVQNEARVKEILSWYPTMTESQRTNLLRIINYGRIGGSGKFVILPVDQGWEHGPGRSFQPNPAGYDPIYHAKLAIDAGCNAYAAPLGAVEAAVDVAGDAQLPVILKVNSHSTMMPDRGDPFPAITAWVDDAVRLGCVAVGFTIYPGSNSDREMCQQVKELVDDARRAGLVVVVWAYPRGGGLPYANFVGELAEDKTTYFTKEDVESAVDVVCYGVHIACQLGAHIIKCKPTTKVVALPEHRKKGKETYAGVAIETLADRTKLVVQSAFDGHRIVINSGGAAKAIEAVLAEVRELKAGGSFGSIMGRNSFQRPYGDGVTLLHQVQDVWAE